MTEPKSITELKPGSNYLIVFGRTCPADARELADALSATGAGFTALFVPDGSSVDVAEVFGPSLAEVLALLRDMVGRSYDVERNPVCPSCFAVVPLDANKEPLVDACQHANCALDAMIKRLEALPVARGVSSCRVTPPRNPRPPRMVGS